MHVLAIQEFWAFKHAIGVSAPSLYTESLLSDEDELLSMHDQH